MKTDFPDELVDHRPTVFATVIGFGAFMAGYWTAAWVTSLVGAVLLKVLALLQIPTVSVRPALILVLEAVNGGVALWVSARTARRLFSEANHRIVVNVIVSVVIGLMFLNLLLAIEALRPSHGIYGVLAIATGTLIARRIVRR